MNTKWEASTSWCMDFEELMNDYAKEQIKAIEKLQSQTSMTI